MLPTLDFKNIIDKALIVGRWGTVNPLPWFLTLSALTYMEIDEFGLIFKFNDLVNLFDGCQISWLGENTQIWDLLRYCASTDVAWQIFNFFWTILINVAAGLVSCIIGFSVCVAGFLLRTKVSQSIRTLAGK